MKIDSQNRKDNPNWKTLPQEVIDQVIGQQDILDIVSSRIKLQREGKDYKAKCPFHKENTPSFTVSPSKQFFYCFGCGQGGNALEFLRDFDGAGFIPIIKEMAERAGIDITPYLNEAQKSVKELQLMPALKDANELFVNDLFDPAGKVGLDYLRNERQIPDELIHRYQLGYAGYGKRLVEKLSHHQEALIDAGVFDHGQSGDVFSLFRDRVTFPVRDARGNIIGLSGRVLNDEDKPKYRNSKESTLFARNNVLYGLYEAIQGCNGDKLDVLYVPEGQLDVIANAIIGLPAAAAMGSSVSTQQLRLMIRFAKKVIFVFDGDDAGRKAMRQVGSLLIENLNDMEVPFEFCSLPEGDDPHKMITKGRVDVYEEAISHTTPWLESLFTSLDEYAERLSSDQARMQYAEVALGYIHEAKDPLIRYNALKLVEKLSEFPVDVLEAKIKSFPAPRQTKNDGLPKAMNTASIRLARMLWDNPEEAVHLKHYDILKQSDDEMTVMLAMWAEAMSSGDYDLPLQPDDLDEIASSPQLEPLIRARRRAEGAAQAFGRLTSMLPSEITQSLMAEAPEENKSLPFALAMHITAQAATHVMQELTRRMSGTTVSQADRDLFTKAMLIRNDANKRVN
ncbi:DNA primase [Pseudomonas aeruginosa]